MICNYCYFTKKDFYKDQKTFTVTCYECISKKYLLKVLKNKRGILLLVKENNNLFLTDPTFYSKLKVVSMSETSSDIIYHFLLNNKKWKGNVSKKFPSNRVICLKE